MKNFWIENPNGGNLL
jgi:hypothetical protein